jgi:cell filamentation protein, protein adenylyltransferase
MNRGLLGHFIRRTTAPEPFAAFVPRPLPPDPPLEIDPGLLELLGRAERALGRLDGVSTLLPDPSLFLYLYVRKEALLSSQIEGTQSSLADLLLYESQEVPGVPLADVQEVSRYVAALDHGMARLRGGFPLSSRLIREIHSVLLASGRGAEKAPGEFRRTQNWVGGTRPGNALFVPPPPEEVEPCMGDLEKFLHSAADRMPALLKAALAHLQFETIHPFLDGNGRVGRLLITLILCAEGELSEPLLYLSLYFKTHRQRYYELLQSVRQEGDWETWLEFFLEGVVETAEEGSSGARWILDLFARDRQRVEGLGRSSGSALRLHQLLERHPLLTIRRAAEQLGVSQPTAATALGRLQELGIVREVTGRPRDRLFVYGEYLELIRQGDEPLHAGTRK